MKQFRAPRGTPDKSAFHSYASQEETASQVTSSPPISSQSYPISSVSYEQSSVFDTPPSQVSPFVTEELDLDAGLPRAAVSMSILSWGKMNHGCSLFEDKLVDRVNFRSKQFSKWFSEISTADY